MNASPLVFVSLLTLPALACSPAADPVGKGGAHFQIANPTDPTVEGSCALNSVGGIGSPPPELPVANKADDFGEEVTDGDTIEGTNGSYEVQCTVTNGDSHKIDLTLVGPNTSPLADVASSGEVKVEVHGTIGSDGTGEGTVSVRTTKSGPNTNQAGYPCQLWAIPEEDDPDSFMIDGGKARFTFLCSRAQTPLSDFSVCETRGTISVYNCLK